MDNFETEAPKPNWLSHKFFGYAFLVLVFIIAVFAIYQWQYGGQNNSINSFDTCIDDLYGSEDIDNRNTLDFCKTKDGRMFSNPRFENQLLPDPTANWQTYRNEEFGFEFKYPEDFSYDDGSNSLSGQNMISDSEGYSFFRFEVEEKQFDPDNIIGPGGKIIPDEVEVGGRISYKYRVSDSIGSVLVTHVPLDDNSNLGIFADVLHINASQENLTLFDQILSTFKFIN